MSKLNECILLVMKYLDDQSSVSKDELEKNRKAYAADAYAAYAYAYAYAYADADADADADAAAEKWVNKYFERSGEIKQDYIDAIEAGKSGVVDMPIAETLTEWDGKGLPPIGCECEAAWLEMPDGGTPTWTKGRFKGGYDSKIWFGTIDFIEMVVPAHNINFRPLKTEAEKDREAFIQRCVSLTEMDGVMAVEGFGIAYDDGARFTAPKGGE